MSEITAKVKGIELNSNIILLDMFYIVIIIFVYLLHFYFLIESIIAAILLAVHRKDIIHI